jgi:hypothetical protein
MTIFAEQMAALNERHGAGTGSKCTVVDMERPSTSTRMHLSSWASVCLTGSSADMNADPLLPCAALKGNWAALHRQNMIKENNGNSDSLGQMNIRCDAS